MMLQCAVWISRVGRSVSPTDLNRVKNRTTPGPRPDVRPSAECAVVSDLNLMIILIVIMIMIACWLERQTRDRNVARSNPGKERR